MASPELGRLNIQLWDKDIIKWNDVIGSTQLDLYRWLLKAFAGPRGTERFRRRRGAVATVSRTFQLAAAAATVPPRLGARPPARRYRENRTVDVFKEINDAIRRKRAEEAGLATDEDLQDMEDESSGSDEDASDDGSEGGGGGGGGSDGGHEETKEAAPDGGGGGADDAASAKGSTSSKKKKKTKKTKDDDDEPEAPPEPDPLGKQEMDDRDAQFFVAQLKNMCGVGPLDETAQWLRLTYKDQKRHRVLARGAIAISVEILPAEDAENRPAGPGISDPNTNPTLPPRTGRMALTADPFAILSELFGPRCMTIFCCALCCAIFMVLWFYLGMYFVNIYTEMQAFGLTGGDDD